MAAFPQHNVFMKYAAVGTEFSVTIGLMMFLGYQADKKLDSSPLGMIAGLVAGFGIGLYVLLKQARQAKKEMDAQSERDQWNKNNDSK